jgi:hypothetical protein
MKTARAKWERIIQAASTAEHHAAILDARHRLGRDDPPPYPRLVDAYLRTIEQGRFRRLDTLRLTAADLTDLAAVVAAGPQGTAARRVDAASRQRLHRARLVVHLNADGRPTGPDVACTVRATLPGVAVTRGAENKPLPLSSTDAAALAALGADGGTTTWPGTATSLRVSLYWGLVRYAGGRYRLTGTGRSELARHRATVTTDLVIPSDRQSEVLIHGLRHPHGMDMAEQDSAVVQQCITRQWIVRAGQIDGTRRCRYRVTESGRDALARWEEQDRRRRIRPERLTLSQLEIGQWVRLVKRSGLPVTARYVQVVDNPRPTGRVIRAGNRGWEVWVVDHPGDTPYLYGGRAFYTSTKYEVRQPVRVAA